MARKILLADDSVTAQNMGRKILADAGYEVITVNNGSAALKKIAEQKPDLIVLDVYMPGYSGLEVCQRLKEAKETARIPVLLTVGKLEPFKPEEAKRVRAEGFIVKPFEASELLSALSKLEDRVVPRAESSKPGRFARAIAAVEEGRADENAEANDADDGWKSRLVFPSKKKKKQKEEEEYEDDTYNPVNRDLRTIVDRPRPDREAVPKVEAVPKADETRLDVAALAAVAGLPKDVTPEELAALAAAAAQVQAAVEGRDSESSVEDRAALETALRADVKDAPAIESKTEAKVETLPVPPRPPVQETEVAAGATFAQQTGPADTKVVRDFDVIAASADIDSGNAEAGSGNGTGHSLADTAKKEAPSEHARQEHARQEEEETAATIAAAAGASFVAAGSTHRWTAVPVAVAAEEAALSLEQEMQKAYAAFTAAEANQPGFMTGAPPAGHAGSALAAVEPAANPTPNEDEISRTLRDVANASADAVDSTLAKLDAVGAEHAEKAEAEARQLAAARELELKELELKEAEKREQEARELEAKAREAREQEAREEELRQQEIREREAREQAAREQEAREQEARAEAARLEAARQEEARQEEARQQEIREREAREQAAREQEARDQEARAEAARLEAARQEEARQEEARQQEIREREAREQAAREQEAREQEARAEAARLEAVRQEEARQEEARQQEIREREAREQAAREQEAREQEARAEAARLEAARQEEARQEEARQEEARQQEIREREAREQAAREQEAREREREEKERQAREQEARELEAKQREIAAAEAIIAEAVAAAARTRVSESPAADADPAPRKEKANGKDKLAGGDMAEKENEIAATTAAAWASWRQIRESGDKSKATGGSKAKQQDDDEEDYPEPVADKAAMAVAAGAEKSPSSEEVAEGSAADPEAIANIVDKVLADLRPKIAEEISKKLKKK